MKMGKQRPEKRGDEKRGGGDTLRLTKPRAERKSILKTKRVKSDGKWKRRVKGRRALVHGHCVIDEIVCKHWPSILRPPVLYFFCFAFLRL